MVSWHVENNAVINYMACHDNNTLYDKLLASNGDDSEEARLQMNRFGISILMIGKGIPFFLAGEEMLRSKNGDSNSYASGDEVNNIRWDELTAGSEAMKMRDYYRSLIAMRKANAFLTRGEVTCEVVRENAIEAVYTMDGETAAFALINPTETALEWSYGEGRMTDRYETPLGARYASDEMMRLFSADTRYQTWRKLWVALARAEMELGLPVTEGRE